MKFVHSERGPVIQIFDGPYEPVELPASMFTEVSQFLISQGVLKGLSSAHKAPVNAPLAMPSIARKRPAASSPPAPPRLTRPMTQIAAPAEDDEQGYDEEDSQAAAGAAALMSTIREQVDPAPVSPEEAKRLLQERLAAKAKSNAGGKRVRSNPKFEG
jgi:hypothetical protein